MTRRVLVSVGASFVVAGIYALSFSSGWAGHSYIASIGLSSMAYLLAWDLMS